MSFAVRPLALGPERQVPPTAVLSMLHFDGANNSTTFTDAAGTLTWTRSGDAKISTAQYVFGGASGYFDGNGDYITSGSSSGLKNLLTESFTLSGWIRPTGVGGDGTRVFSTGGGAVGWNSTNGIQVLVQLLAAAPNTKLNLQLINGSRSGSVSMQSTVKVQGDAWTHIVAQCDLANNLIGVGVNGVMTYAERPAIGVPSNTPVAAFGTIPGELGLSTYAFSGYMDEMRLALGVAQYTGTTYQVPSAPYLP